METYLIKKYCKHFGPYMFFFVSITLVSISSLESVKNISIY